MSEASVHCGALSTAITSDEKAAKKEDRHSNGGGQPRRKTKEKESEAENCTF